MRFVFALAMIFSFFSSGFSDERIFYWRGDKNIKKAALTFDDGPGNSTLKILEILKEKGVKATFFMLGRQSERNPNDSKKIADEGHEIATHTYGHVNFYAYKEEDKLKAIDKELALSLDIIEKNTGTRPFLVRFPYGYCGQDALDIAKENGCYAVNWTFGCDWDQNLTAEQMRDGYLKALENGAVFLMHDAPKNAKILTFLADFIDAIQKEGYEIVTVSQLLGITNKKGGNNGKHLNIVN
ncbi:MAG: polysaccharide deacetylase family protein [Endomicrobium sp.]|jgi:peptidoglycan/xylan/chitin deacetylase (PgdA/CDA1 family)|nr:polysaccharide deacetylase family protein [Endomicrobium sp.]